MRSAMRWLSLVLVGLLGACAAPSPSPSPPASAGGAPVGSIVYGQFADAKLLNPILANDGSSQLVWENIFESLVKTDPQTGEPIPGLATSWDTSPDSLVYTFHLKAGVTWSDGQPFTADDVKFTIDTIRDPKTQSPFKSQWDLLSAVDVVDPLTVRVTLSQNLCSFLLTNMTQAIVPKHILASSSDINTDAFNTSAPIGTGPFVFKEWKKDDHATLVANVNYWQGAPKIQQWSLRVVKDAAAVVAGLKTGELDYATFDPDFLDDLSQQPNLTIISSANRSYDYLASNLDRPPFDDARVRQALAASLDRTQFVQKVLYGQGQVIDSPVLPSSWAFNAQVPRLAYNLDGARKLLADAGWSPGTDGTLQKDGKPFALTITTNSGNKMREAAAVIAQDQYAKLGIKTDIRLLELNAFLDSIQKNHDFDVIVYGRALNVDPDQVNIWSSSAYPGGENYGHYRNPQVDQALSQARTVPGCAQATRKTLYDGFQTQVANDQPATFLYNRTTLTAVNKRLHGLAPGAWVRTAWNIKDWTIAP
jgi:peptide/nickel transport system substrate-binding protein